MSLLYPIFALCLTILAGLSLRFMRAGGYGVLRRVAVLGTPDKVVIGAALLPILYGLLRLLTWSRSPDAWVLAYSLIVFGVLVAGVYSWWITGPTFRWAKSLGGIGMVVLVYVCVVVGWLIILSLLTVRIGPA
jgi:hypothetical protein